MARAGKTKKKPKIVIRKTAAKPVSRKTPARPSSSKSLRSAPKTPVRKVLKKAAVKKKVSRLAAGVRGVRKVLLKTARKIARGFSAKKKTLKPRPVSAAKKPVKKKAANAKKIIRPSLPQKQRSSLPSAVPAPRPVPKVRRVRAAAAAPALAKKDVKVPYGELRVSLARKKKLPSAAAAPSVKKKTASAAPRISAVSQAPEGPSSAPVSCAEPVRELPSNYGDNLIYLMVRDPRWIYAYWELQKDYVEGRRESLGGTWGEICTVLRVYDVTESTAEPAYQDLYLGGITDHWHIHACPDRSYYVEIGLLHKDGRFLSLARSNSVHMPLASMSDVLDEQWMDIDFDKVYALSGGFEVGKSSQELRRLMEERMEGKTSSGSGSGVGIVSSLSSPGSGSWSVPAESVRGRKFFFWLDCEVIVYGGTEPDAKVTFQGKVIKLRPDGTFSFRFALPDGKFVFDAKAESSDGVEERVITPVVQRETSRPAPVFKQGKV